MSEENNEALVRKFYDEVWNKGNLAAADEVFADDYVRHDLRPGNPSPGPEGQKKIARDFRNAFPDLRLTPSFIISDGQMVVVRWVIKGTHKGKWADVEPTGRKVEFSGVNIFRFEKGKVAEIWNYRDDLGLIEQVGARVYAGSKQ